MSLEAPEPSKAELFAENPDRFEDLKKCLLVVKRNDDGKMMFLIQCETEEEGAVLQVQFMDSMLAWRGAMRAKKAQTGIVKPNGRPHFMQGFPKKR